nr:hypothetical protein [Embleya scabrispora]
MIDASWTRMASSATSMPRISPTGSPQWRSGAVWTGNYRLGLELDDAGFDFSVLSDFPDRMAEGDRVDRLPAMMVDRLAEAGLVRRRGRQRTDSTHVLAAVRRLDRIELVGETLRSAPGGNCSGSSR